jgi:hypothetical protein
MPGKTGYVARGLITIQALILVSASNKKVCLIGDSVFRRSLEMHAAREHISRMCAENQYCLTFRYNDSRIYFGHILGFSSVPPHVHHEKFTPSEDSSDVLRFGREWEWPLKSFRQHLRTQKQLHGTQCETIRVLSNAWDCQQHRLKDDRGNTTAQSVWLSRYLQTFEEVMKLYPEIGMVTMHRPASIDTMCSLGLNVFTRNAAKKNKIEIFDWEHETFDAIDADVLIDPLHLTDEYAKRLLDMIIPK